ncbi:MAG: hypothetical protein JRM80_06900 [Nitrososphaerota archaeon]|nr:hypothetical protein [Nitrososphaerota archaeon]
MSPARLALLAVIVASTIVGAAAYAAVIQSRSNSTGSTTYTTTTGSTSTTVPPAGEGTLSANFDVGPIQPVCRANSTVEPDPSLSQNELVIIAPSGLNRTIALYWQSNGCDAFSSAEVSLAPGSYALTLSNCEFMGCRSALPKSFSIVAGRTTVVNVSIDTGIR